MSDNIQTGSILNQKSSASASLPPGALILPPEMAKAITAAIHRFETVVGKFIGVQLPKAPQHAWEKFSAIPEPIQMAIIQGVNFQADFAQSAMDDGLDAVNELAMLNWAKGKFGLLSEYGETSDVAEGDVVEIFDKNHIQLYRSYSCFSLCNYSLLELTSYPWFELYERPSSITNMFLDVMPKIYEGQSTFISYVDLPEYTLREVMTDNRAAFGIKEKFMAKMRSTINGETYILSVKKIREFPAMSNAGSVRYI